MRRPPLPCRFPPASPVCLVAAAPLPRITRFKQLMAADGQFVSVHRMCLDRVYAQERLARAHGSADERLRTVALLLFHDYQAGHTVRLRR